MLLRLTALRFIVVGEEQRAMTQHVEYLAVVLTLHQADLAEKICVSGASLVAQWLRICLLMQGTRVRALVWEDPTCRGAAGPVSHNY